jgi:hypothetical protein
MQEAAMARSKPKRAPHARAAPTPAAPPGVALVLRDPDAKGVVALTAEGLALVESTSREGGSQGLIASRLGIALSTLKQVMERTEAARVAYEKGRAELEHELTVLLLAAARKGAVVPLLYATKALFGWSDQPSVAPTQVGIQITLPDSLSPDAWAERQRARAVALSGPSDAAPIDVESKEVTNDK